MAKIQLDSGPSSSATHRLTQPSSVVNRRAMERPTNLAIEEAAQVAAQSPRSNVSTPSRLVNLRVHAADLIAPEPSQPEPAQTEPVTSTPIVPKVLELGGSHTIAKEEVEALANVIDFNQIVPAEAPLEEITPTATVAPAVPVAPVTPQASIATPVMTNEVAIASANTMSMAPVSTSGQELAMNIAADYAAASLGTSLSVPNGSSLPDTTAPDSIDTIARAASEAIAAIRTATGPAEIAKQITSLQAFAETLRHDSSMPEMTELSNTIEKFISVAMKSSAVQDALEQQQAVQVNTKKAQASSSAIKVSAQPSTRKSTASAHSIAAQPTPIRRPVTKRQQPTPKRRAATTRQRPSLVDDEDQALRNVLRSVADIDDSPAAKPAKRTRRKGSGKRFALAVFCAIFCVAIVVYLVGSNIPDISVKVAAIQTGVEASYPTYIPRDYSLSDISSEEGKLTMTFNGPDKASFSIIEEKSSWDSTTLLRNYVEPTWQTNYVTTHEQGITIFISGSNAAWVNGGVMYKINANGNTLTKKQLRNIVTSM